MSRLTAAIFAAVIGDTPTAQGVTRYVRGLIPGTAHGAVIAELARLMKRGRAHHR